MERAPLEPLRIPRIFPRQIPRDGSRVDSKLVFGERFFFLRRMFSERFFALTGHPPLSLGAIGEEEAPQ